MEQKGGAEGGVGVELRRELGVGLRRELGGGADLQGDVMSVHSTHFASQTSHPRPEATERCGLHSE